MLAIAIKSCIQYSYNYKSIDLGKVANQLAHYIATIPPVTTAVTLCYHYDEASWTSSCTELYNSSV